MKSLLALLLLALTTSPAWAGGRVRSGDDPGVSSTEAGRFRQVSAGIYNACALRDDGEVVCWGYKAQTLRAPTGPFVHIDTAIGRVCGVRQTGMIECWGTVRGGERRHMPDGPFVRVLARETGGCGFRSDGTAACWTDRGGWGIAAKEGEVVELAFSPTEFCALDGGGRTSCWGAHVPGLFVAPTELMVDIDTTPTGNLVMCGVSREDGSLRCWGQGRTDEPGAPTDHFVFTDLGGPARGSESGSVSQQSARVGREVVQQTGLEGTLAGNTIQSAAAVAGLLAEATADPIAEQVAKRVGFHQVPSGSFTALAVGSGLACALDSDGLPRCWGAGAVPAPARRLTSIDVGGSFACGLTDDARIVCWGEDFKGMSTPP